MLAYIIRRILLIFPTLFIVTAAVFLSVRFIPGDIIDMMVSQMTASGAVSEASVESLRHNMGLDVPIPLQYVRWLGVWPQEDGGFHGLLEGDLGKSLWKGTSVTSMLFERLPISLELGIIAIITALLSSIPLGIYSAVRRDTWGDYAGRTVSILFLSVPAFWIGTLIMVYPAIWWTWSPSMRYIPITQDFWGNMVQFLIPGFIDGMLMGGTLMRITRTMMLEVLRQDYIRTAWAKGLNERTVILRHALKNAFIPIVTVIGVMIPMIVGGTVVIEQIFVLPGVGMLTLDVLNNRDYTVISGINIFLATIVLVVNLVVDLTYAYLDPRIKYQ